MTTADPLPWLLESSNASARYWTLTSLLDQPSDDPDVKLARSEIPGQQPARAILDAQWPDGYWMHPGVGYSPRHRATIWQIIFLGALGAPPTKGIDRACAYVLNHSRLPDGRFSAYKTDQGATLCLNGNLLRAMLQVGCADPRLQESLEAMAEMIASDGFRCRFNTARPFPTHMRDGLPCAWGAIKALGAFAEVNAERRTPAMQAATESGIAFLLSGNLAQGEYPTATEASPLWHRFGFPLGYSSDLLEASEVLGQIGVGRHPQLSTALDLVLDKADESARWRLDYTPDNTWASFGQTGQANKWVTIRALRALKGRTT